MSVPPLPPLREVIARHALSARKSLGQNFLLDTQLLARIARVPGDLAGADVYEVGPGPGGLTRALLDAGARVVAVEPDRRALAALAELAEERPGRLVTIEGDALSFDPRPHFASRPFVIANLPYNIGTRLLVEWLSVDEWLPWWHSLTLMFQREVADRIVAGVGSSAYGRLSVLSQWRCTARLAMTVNRAAFVPPPKVASAVVHLVPHDAPDRLTPGGLARLTAAAFGQRRKMLRASLRGLNGALEALETVGIAADRRAETVSVPEWVAVAQAWEALAPMELSSPARSPPPAPVRTP